MQLQHAIQWDQGMLAAYIVVSILVPLVLVALAIVVGWSTR
jgi:hypothetical protein